MNSYSPDLEELEDVFEGLCSRMKQLLLQNQKIELAVSELSIAAKVFDPLGLLEPFTVKAKMMLQELWKQKVSWDSQLPEEL